MALDATVVSPQHGDATHRRSADIEDGVALREGRRRKERTPSCARATAVRVWWSLREKSGAGGLKRPRRSCGQDVVSAATDVRQCPSRLAQEVDRASWLALSAKAVACSLLGKEGSPGAGAVIQRGGG